MYDIDHSKYIGDNMNDKEIAYKLEGIPAFDGLLLDDILNQDDVDTIISQMVEVLLKEKLVFLKLKKVIYGVNNNDLL